MNNADSGIIRLQPRQLYDMVVAYQDFYPTCTNEAHIETFGQYKDRNSIACAVNDFNKILKYSKGNIEIILGPIQEKGENEERVPYLHDTCENNLAFAHMLGINKNQKYVTFSKLIGRQNESFQAYKNVLLNIAADMIIKYDALELRPEQELKPRSWEEQKELLRKDFLHQKNRDERLRKEHES